MNKQENLINQLSDREILLNLYVTQIIMLLLAFLFGLFLFDDWSSFIALFTWDLKQILLIGGGVAMVVVLVEIVLAKVLPDHWLDDGGINERVFAKRGMFHIAIIAAVVAVAEEILFRGVLQTHIGWIPASLLFAFIHFRYLSKVVLFTVVVVVSLLLGWIFLLTGNLLVTIMAHFLIDFILGLNIALQSRQKG
ncbi:CPBP family intramembrane glutamic endopeptidase [Desertibacillus haloalkaliphilus]|uniref:CPBP family intramembrane glutamic endopeptidase n=1 Tax=Desertibacillus haloalkaliphilus TaxID=1328930 RepID=UPI001C2731D4|nr:CPBP family intramembrane glutamic endopeptidase [Desertibacillus haloalkaliphilus]MBU8907202.1 CPBP family intramembrane metalloprotease [Desertibacillus haloalkaliphilus]